MPHPATLSHLVLGITAIVFAIGLDVFALSAGIGIAGVTWPVRLRVGGAFAFAEISAQVIGMLIGTGAGRLFGDLAAYAGFTALALLGAYMWYESAGEGERTFSSRATSGWGLVVASLSISLDSLGVGFSIPALGLPLAPLFVVVACSTVLFTLGGLAFGERLGARFQHLAERGAALVLIVLAIGLVVQRSLGLAL